MQRHESTVARSFDPGRSLGGGLPLIRVRGRTVAIAVVLTLAAAAAAIVGSAERDAWLRQHPAVPSLVGLTVAEAARMMVPLHFGLVVNHSAQHPEGPMGLVLAQKPAPGSRLGIGSIVQVTASQGSGVVPHLRGQPAASAARALESVGLRLGKVQAIEDRAPLDTVLEQFTPPGRRLAPNGAVDVLVSGPPYTPPAQPEPSPAAIAQIKAAGVPGAPARTPPSAPRGGAPVAAPGPDLDLAPTFIQEDPTGGRATSGQCSTHAERERVEVCHQPEGDRGAQPDVHRPEHRGVPASP